jgi:hypothetical protein
MTLTLPLRIGPTRCRAKVPTADRSRA